MGKYIFSWQEAVGKRSLMNMYEAIHTTDGRPDHRHPPLRGGGGDSQHNEENELRVPYFTRYDYRYDGFEG